MFRGGWGGVFCLLCLRHVGVNEPLGKLGQEVFFSQFSCRGVRLGGQVRLMLLLDLKYWQRSRKRPSLVHCVFQCFYRFLKCAKAVLGDFLFNGQAASCTY